MYRIERKVDVQLTEKEIVKLHREYLEAEVYQEIKAYAPKDIPMDEIEKAVDETTERLLKAHSRLFIAECENAVASLIVNSKVRHGEQK